MKPSLVEEEDEDVPDSGSLKSFSVTVIGSRAACDEIHGVAPDIEIEISEANGEVAKVSQKKGQDMEGSNNV